MIKKSFKNRIIFLSIIISILFTFNCFSKEIRGVDVWLAWSNYEFNNMSYGAVANTTVEDEKLKVYGYGRYQFKYNTNLCDFLSYLDNTTFKKWIEYGKGSEKLNKLAYGLQNEWADYYINHKDFVIEKEDEYIYDTYYKVVENYLNGSGKYIQDDGRVRGAILSFIMRNVINNEISNKIQQSDFMVQQLIKLYDSDPDKYINNIYNKLLEMYQNDDSMYQRFKKEKQFCLEGIENEFTSKIGEILISSGESLNINIIKDINNEDVYFADFLSNYKFHNDDTKEWFDTIRTSVNFRDEFNVSSGVIDFKTETSKGINLNNYYEMLNEEIALTIPDNNTSVYYIPQNGIATYSQLKFGAVNVAQGGGSLACLSMAINKYYTVPTKEMLVLPSTIRDKIIELYDDYNYFYDEKKKGQKNEIIINMAKQFGLTTNVISKSSVYDSLSKGHLIIARVQESEFTEHGQFVLLCKTEVKDEKIYIILHDPNIYHASYCFKMYSLDYLADECKSSFIEVYKDE